jgi:hypothetical protein
MKAIAIALLASLATASETVPIDLRLEYAFCDKGMEYDGNVYGGGTVLSIDGDDDADSAGRVSGYGLAALSPSGMRGLVLVGAGVAHHRWSFESGDTTALMLEGHGGFGLDITPSLRAEVFGTLGVGRMEEEATYDAGTHYSAAGSAVSMGLRAGLTVQANRIVAGAHVGLMSVRGNMDGDGSISGVPITTIYTADSSGPLVSFFIGLRL